jgi:hypothetical protein
MLIVIRHHLGIRAVRQLFFGFAVEFQGRDDRVLAADDVIFFSCCF